MVHICCNICEGTEKASDDFPGGSKTVEVEQGVMHAVHAVTAETAVLIGEDTSGESIPKPFFFFHVVGGQIEHGLRISFQLLLHGMDKSVSGAFSDGGLVVRAAVVDSHTGGTEAGRDVVDPFLQPIGGNEEMVVLRRIKPFLGIFKMQKHSK